MTFPFVEFGILLFVIVVFGSAAYASMKAAPWVPVHAKDISRILAHMELSKRELVYDLGSGDGRILIAVGQNSHCRAVGFEVSMIPYVVSRIRILLAGVRRRAEVLFSNFLTYPLRDADVVFCFLTPMAMKKLAVKFANELKPGTRVLSYAFSIPGWTPTLTDKPDQRSVPLFVYDVPLDAKKPA